MLTENNFRVLSFLISHAEEKPTQRLLSGKLKFSLGKVNEVVTELKTAGLIDEQLEVTRQGMEVMQFYKVNNAIIMAAGMSSRFAPLSYERPKALLRVKGELLIEREIEQLQAAGITDITIVVGYLKEQLFYLEKKYNVNIVINEDYYRFNNTSTLMRVLDKLDNTYICSSDNYFAENPFEPYVYRAYYSSVYAPGKTDEYCIVSDKKGKIVDVTVGGRASWYMLGHVYFDRSFSQKFTQILKDQYDSLQTRLCLWEDLYIRNIKKLDMYVRHYDGAAIKEFDSLEELREFDEKYLINADSEIFANICSVLQVAESDITNIVPIKKGLTNLSFGFTVFGEEYVYRHPGAGTSNYISRASEAKSQQAAKKLGLDETFIYMDVETGWKLSHFVKDAVTLDYHNEEHVAKSIAMMKKLHSSGENTGHTFDIWAECLRMEEMVKSRGRNQFQDMQQMHSSIEELMQLAAKISYPQCLCHCDCYDSNFLLNPQGEMYLIDWEYSGMSQRGVDIGTFVACSDYTLEEACRIIDQYLGHKSNSTERAYFMTYIAMASYYWFIWAIYQETIGKSVGEYLYIWYNYARQYAECAFREYQEVK